jgi:hypothetical protein
VHEQFGTNLIGELVAKGDAERACGRAAPLQRRFHHHRFAALPIECRVWSAPTMRAIDHGRF